MSVDPTRMCELLVGLADVAVLEVTETDVGGLRVKIETGLPRPTCARCGGAVHVKDRNDVEHADLPCFGRSTALVWHKIRWRCATGCGAGSFTETCETIAASPQRLTDRAGRWVTDQVGQQGRAVSGVAGGLGARWDAVMDAVVAYSEALVDDPNRFGEVEAIGKGQNTTRTHQPLRYPAVVNPDCRCWRWSVP